jgi:hypothetical protein
MALGPSVTSAAPTPNRTERLFAVGLFLAASVFFAWGVSVGWTSRNLPGVEFRQAQTALSAYWIQRDDDFSLAYPTPVLGKPWSIPMEFPLYQWTVVLVSNATGLELTAAGRAVSVGSFLSGLPALWLLLGFGRVAPARRLLALAVVLTCPLYVFYGRAFLIETMALSFALWFAVGYVRTVQTRRVIWWVIALLAGVGAGLTKVTTFLIYLVPLAVWSVGRLWQGRKVGGWRKDVPWMAAAVVLPLGVAAWWVGQADRIKALNPVADFLSSANLQGFNLGTVAMRLSPEVWLKQARIVFEEITVLPALLLVIAAGVVLAPERRWAIAACLGTFAAGLALFPLLFALHDYYFVANAVLLLLAAGVALAGLAESARWRPLALGAALALCGAQGWRYGEHYWPTQRAISLGGDAFTETLQTFTPPGTVLLFVGEDWSSISPYYAQRRALMFPAGAERDLAKVDAALANLQHEEIGALVVTTALRHDAQPVVQRLAGRGLATQPWLTWGERMLYFPDARWEEIRELMRTRALPGLRWAEGVTHAPEKLAGHWRAWGDLTPAQREVFADFSPSPVRFYFSFEPTRQDRDGDKLFFAHPWTRLIYALPAGTHTLSTRLWLNPDALKVPPGEPASDGVRLRVLRRGQDGSLDLLTEVTLDPSVGVASEGGLPVKLPFALDEAGEVEVCIDPGVRGQDMRDWVSLRGAIRIE